MALEVLKKAEREARRREGGSEGRRPTRSPHFSGTEPSERAKLELARDEQLRRTQDEDKRYQIAKDLSDNLTISYNTSEVIMARLMQTTSAKERVYAQAVTFFSTNDSVLTALKASFTGMFGLHESTKTLDAMKEGMSKSLDTLSEVGDKVTEAAVRSGYGPTIRADAVKKLVDSVVNFQERSTEIIAEMRKLSTQNSAEIRDAVEEGKKRMARLIAAAETLACCRPDGSRWRSLHGRDRGCAEQAADARRRHDRDGRGGHAAPSRGPGAPRAQRGGSRERADRPPAPDLPRPGHRGAGPRAGRGRQGAQGEPLRLHAAAGRLEAHACSRCGRKRETLWQARWAWPWPLLVAVFVGYYVLVSRPAKLAEERARIEITETLPKALRQAHADVMAVAGDEAAKQKADALLADGERAIRTGDRAGDDQDQRPSSARCATS